MRNSLPLLAVCSFVFLGSARPVRAQSLGDLARKEAERRQTLPEAVKVITNNDVPVVAQPDVPPPSDLDIPALGAQPEDKDKAATADSTTSSSDVRDQKYWGDRQKALQNELEQDEFLSQAVQSRINGLTADFVNRDDPAQRAVIAGDRQKALDEATRLSSAIDQDKKNIADFEEEARRANVPPGWLR